MTEVVGHDLDNVRAVHSFRGCGGRGKYGEDTPTESDEMDDCGLSDAETIWRVG